MRLSFVFNLRTYLSMMGAILICFVPLSYVMAQDEAAPTEQSSVSSENLAPNPPATSEMEAQPENGVAEAKLFEAKRLVQTGDFIAARTIYEEVLSLPNLSSELMKGVQARYEKLNRTILFSRNEVPGESILYKVKAGDSLYKIAKKHKTTIGLIKKINGLENDKIYPGVKLKIVNVPFSVMADKSENIMTLFLAGKPLKTYRVATGVDNKTPVGKFKVVNKLENPTWYKAGAVVPPGSPDNILGTRWLGFDATGYGIHGTTIPESIGKHETSGCIRMLNEEVEEFYDLVPVGTEVTIVD